MSKKWDDFELENGKTISFMRENNLIWWKTVGIYSEKPKKRRKHYKKFLKNIKNNFHNFDIRNYKNQIVGEVCGGPFGGIIEHYLPENMKYQIDIFADDFSKLQWIKSDPLKTKWIDCPCEEIELPDNSMEVLFGFNSIDHGWDYKKSILECIRVSKECYISFDTDRYKNPGYPDLNHYQIIDYNDVIKFVEDLRSDTMEIKHWYRDEKIPNGSIREFGMGVIKK